MGPPFAEISAFFIEIDLYKFLAGLEFLRNFIPVLVVFPVATVLHPFGQGFIQFAQVIVGVDDFVVVAAFLPAHLLHFLHLLLTCASREGFVGKCIQKQFVRAQKTYEIDCEIEHEQTVEQYVYLHPTSW